MPHTIPTRPAEIPEVSTLCQDPLDHEVNVAKGRFDHDVNFLIGAFWGGQGTR
jgi:hypothetical protein